MQQLQLQAKGTKRLRAAAPDPAVAASLVLSASLGVLQSTLSVDSLAHKTACSLDQRSILRALKTFDFHRSQRRLDSCGKSKLQAFCAKNRKIISEILPRPVLLAFCARAEMCTKEIGAKAPCQGTSQNGLLGSLLSY